MSSDTPVRLRLDKWLWHARLFKTRTLASELAGSGRLRINSKRCLKSAQSIRPGDILTFPQGRRIRIIRIEAIGSRRGPAAEAAGLYADLDPPERTGNEKDRQASGPALAERAPGSGRPTKRERREIDALHRERS